MCLTLLYMMSIEAIFYLKTHQIIFLIIFQGKGEDLLVEGEIFSCISSFTIEWRSFQRMTLEFE